ncbi:MAG: GspH/FimT family protein [Psychromonas sp.]|nr:GspH/FimT family protein [Psychromonas sp.]
MGDAIMDHKGFTLIELLITILILSILLVIGIPSYHRLFSQQALIQQTEKLYQFLRLANSESIKQNQKMYVHFCKSHSSNQWKMALTKQANCDCYTINSCLLTDINNENGRAVIDVLADGKQVTLASSKGSQTDDITFAGDQASYAPIRFSVNSGSIILTDLNGSQLKVIQSTTRLKICSLGSSKFGYPKCQ